MHRSHPSKSGLYIPERKVQESRLLINPYRFGGGGGGGETLLVDQSSFDDYQLPQFTSQGPCSQGIALSTLSGKALSRFGIYASNVGTAASFHCELWSNPDQTGTQYGANSSSVSITAVDPVTAAFEVTWSSPVTPPGNFYVVVVPNDSNTFVWRINSANLYGDTSAGQSGYANGGTRSPADFAFKLYGQ